MLPFAPTIQGVGEPGTVTPESVVEVPLVHLSKSLPAVAVVTPVRRTDSPTFMPPMLPLPPDRTMTVPVVDGAPEHVVFPENLAHETVMLATPSAAARCSVTLPSVKVFSASDAAPRAL